VPSVVQVHLGQVLDGFLADALEVWLQWEPLVHVLAHDRGHLDSFFLLLPADIFLKLSSHLLPSLLSVKPLHQQPHDPKTIWHYTTQLPIQLRVLHTFHFQIESA